MTNLINRIVLCLFLSATQLTAFANITLPQPDLSATFELGRNVTLPAGTLVTLETTNRLSSGRATVGTVVPFRVLTNVIVNGRTVIASGTQAIGRVKSIIPSTFNDPAIIQIEVKYVQAVDGQQVNLSVNPVDVEAPMPNEGASIQVGTMVTSTIMNDIVIRVQ